MTRLLIPVAALLVLLVAVAVFVFRFTEPGRSIWQKLVRGRTGVRIERMASICEFVVEHDSRWVSQDPRFSDFVVVCRLRPGVPPDCLNHVKHYRAADPDGLVDVMLVELDGATQRCQVHYDRGRYDSM